MVSILVEPKNALIKQYQKLFLLENVELEFRQNALDAMAAKAMKRKTGARGLRSILEQVLLDMMYELPSQENIEKVVIDEGVVNGDSDPIIIYNTVVQKKIVSDN